MTTISRAEFDVMKLQIIDACRDLLEEKREDIETGIDEGIYEEEDNVENLAGLKELDELLTKFKNSQY